MWTHNVLNDTAELITTVLYDLLPCGSCRKEFNDWCLENVPDHINTEAPYPQSAKDRAYFICQLIKAEDAIRESWLKSVLDNGFSLEPNPPQNGLLPRRNAEGIFDPLDPWLIVGSDPSLGSLPIPGERDASILQYEDDDSLDDDESAYDPVEL